jgi:hypothetical protein
VTKEDLLRYEFIEVIVLQVVSRVVPLFAQLAWRGAMTPRRREGIWIPEKWALLIWQFGPLTMLPFAWITRRRRGVLEGARALILGAAATTACVAVLYAIEMAFDLRDQEATPSGPPAPAIPAKKTVR